MQQFGGQAGADNSLLANYVDRYGDALVRRRANVAVQAARIEAELAYKARGEFLAHMNHELRTPLNAIIGFTTMIRDGRAYGIGEEQTSEYLEYILQSADLLLSHINTLLEIAAAESGGAKISKRLSTADEIIDDAVSKVRDKASEHQVEITLSVDPDLPSVHVDPDKIAVAVQHLLENALIQCAPGAVISIVACLGRPAAGMDWVYFAVRDTGEGMAPEELDRSLRIFEQIHQGLHRKYEGSGIGLPIAKSFIELNDGRFDVKSTKGRGTTVRFALPAPASGANDGTLKEEAGLAGETQRPQQMKAAS